MLMLVGAIGFRFREGSDTSTGSTGWFVDDVVVSFFTSVVCNTDTPGPSPTGESDGCAQRR